MSQWATLQLHKMLLLLLLCICLVWFGFSFKFGLFGGVAKAEGAFKGTGREISGIGMRDVKFTNNQ